MGDSKNELSSFPLEVKKAFGFALRLVQNGETPESAKPLPYYGSGVFELKKSNDGNTYRTVYLIKLKKAVYVIDAFMKKSKTGKKIPKETKERIEERIATAKKLDKEK
jgi:phage-related protein